MNFELFVLPGADVRFVYPVRMPDGATLVPPFFQLQNAWSYLSAFCQGVEFGLCGVTAHLFRIVTY